MPSGCLLPHQSAPAKCPCIPTTPRGLGLGQGPQGSEMGLVGVVLGFLSLASVLFSPEALFFTSQMTPSWPLPWRGHQLQITCGGLLGKAGRGMGNLLWFSRDWPTARPAGRLLAQSPCPVPHPASLSWPPHPVLMDVLDSRTGTLTPCMFSLPTFPEPPALTPCFPP